MKKYILALAVAFVLCVPTFAYSSDSFANAVSCPNGQYFRETSGHTTYFFAQVLNTTESWVCGISHGYGYYDYSFDSGSTWRNMYCDSSTGVSNLYFGRSYRVPTAQLSGILTPYSADTAVADICADFLLWENNPNPSPSLPTSFTVPRGNVLYFQVASSSDVNFVSQFSENSGLFSSGNVYGPWGDTYQRISAEASLPGPGIEFPRSGSDAIVWGKGEPLNVLGQTKVGVFTKSCNSGTYYAFYNPAYQSISSSDGFGSASVGSNVTVSGNFSFIRVYSLQQILDISTSTDNYDTYYVGTPDGDGGVTWVDQDDHVNYPSSGGENQEDESISSVSLIESIKRILHNILSEIESIFTFGFSAIRDLVDLMDEFVATFDDLYEWLPEECYTLLIACVSVAIVIGVFKVFL